MKENNNPDVIDIHDPMYKLKGHSSSKESLYNVLKDPHRYDQFKEKCFLPSVRIEGDRLYAKSIKKNFTSINKSYLVFLFFTSKCELMRDYASQYVMIPKKGFMVCLNVDAGSSVSKIVSSYKRGNQRINEAFENTNLVYMTNLEELTYEIIENTQGESSEEVYEFFLNKSSKNFHNENTNFEAKFFAMNENDFGNALNKILKNA